MFAISGPLVWRCPTRRLVSFTTTPDTTRQLVCRVARALERAGVLVILEQMTGTAPTLISKAFFHVLALNYFLGCVAVSTS